MKFSSISSGSNGNCLLVQHEKANIMVDAGISRKKTEEGLEFFGVDPHSLDALFITHEHNDHIKGLGVFLRKYEVPVYATEGTISAILDNDSLGKIDTDLLNVIKPGKMKSISGIDVNAISVRHDANEPVCYRFDTDDVSGAIVTDLGEYDRELIRKLSDLDGILVEANHDERMLMTGFYPYNLKMRIKSNLGHLSNTSCGNLINSIRSERLKHVILGHLSLQNNFPGLAFEAVRNVINSSGINVDDTGLCISVAHRKEPTESILL